MGMILKNSLSKSSRLHMHASSSGDVYTVSYADKRSVARHRQDGPKGNIITILRGKNICELRAGYSQLEVPCINMATVTTGANMHAHGSTCMTNAHTAHAVFGPGSWTRGRTGASPGPPIVRYMELCATYACSLTRPPPASNPVVQQHVPARCPIWPAAPATHTLCSRLGCHDAVAEP